MAPSLTDLRMLWRWWSHKLHKFLRIFWTRLNWLILIRWFRKSSSLNWLFHWIPTVQSLRSRGTERRLGHGWCSLPLPEFPCGLPPPHPAPTPTRLSPWISNWVATTALHPPTTRRERIVCVAVDGRITIRDMGTRSECGFAVRPILTLSPLRWLPLACSCDRRGRRRRSSSAAATAEVIRCYCSAMFRVPKSIFS